MSHTILCRTAQSLLQHSGPQPTTAQVVALLQHEGPLSADEAEILEAGLHRLMDPAEPLLQSFLEAGGLSPLLERSIRPGATHLLERAVGSCPPVMIPPDTGVLIPRPVLLKAILVQVLMVANWLQQFHE